MLIKPSKPLEALISHDLSPLKYHKFKIQSQENNKVCLFEEMTNAPVPSEKKPAHWFKRKAPRPLGHHLLHPQILRLLVLLGPEDFEAQSSPLLTVPAYLNL